MVFISLCCDMFTVNDSELVDYGLDYAFFFSFILVDVNAQKVKDESTCAYTFVDGNNSN